jgi:hypothetical protein
MRQATRQNASLVKFAQVLHPASSNIVGARHRRIHDRRQGQIGPPEQVDLHSDRHIHRLANRGKIPLELIEVGSYLGEDDIVRLDDEYKRSS